MNSRLAVIALAMTSGLLFASTASSASASTGREAALTGASQVTANSQHACVRLTTGQARCWGSNFDGELGDGTDVFPVTTPGVVKNPAGTGPLTGVESVEAGVYISCAVLTNGQARCWGYNGDGEVGDGTQPDYRFLARVVRNHSGTGPLTDVVRIAAGERHTCALLESGQVRCWGQNVAGELGTGSAGPDRHLPQVVLNASGTGPLTGVTQIDAGHHRTCARLANGQARCWGSNENGALGTGDPGDSALPAAVSNVAGTGPLTGVGQISVGGGHGCARLTNGQARCWGNNNDGAVGDGTTGTDRTRPVAVRNPIDSGRLTGVTQLDTGDDNTCARVGNGQVRCWGNNGSGQVGNGTIGGADVLLPVVVTNPAGSAPMAGATQLEVGEALVCARVVGGQLRCWGENLYGQVGDGTFDNDRPRPRRVQA